MNLFIIGFIALRILGLVFFVLLIARLAVGFRESRRNNDDALTVLERRFANGEITDEDFRHMRKVLKT